MSVITIRRAVRDDSALILQFIIELAEYEKLRDQVVATLAEVQSQLFGEHPAAEVLIAEVDGQAQGFALYFQNFSTFLAKPGIYLEDLYVRESARGKGLGLQLIAHVAKRCQELGGARLQWSVLNWNQPAIDFYQSLGAIAQDEWTVMRVHGEKLSALAARAV